MKIRSKISFLLLYKVFIIFGTNFCYAQPIDTKWTLENIFLRIPPLKNNSPKALPMVCAQWFVTNANDKSFQRGEPLPLNYYHELARRGLTQYIPLREQYIPIALAIQKSGAKVIILDSDGGNGRNSYSKIFLHKLPSNFKLSKNKHIYPCPMLQDVWKIRSKIIRTVLLKFKNSGVIVDGVWLDWEIEPLTYGPDRMLQAQSCSRCQQMLPKNLLNGWLSWIEYVKFIHHLRAELFSNFVATPILEVYPKCSIANWETLASTSIKPTRNCWGEWNFRPMEIGKFSATMPVVYGNNIYYKLHCKYPWDRMTGNPLDSSRMDMVYTHVMLGQISENAANVQNLGLKKQCVPWVCRYCPDLDDEQIPILSRNRYREILRHIWLRGADTTQIFNPIRPKHPEIALEEVEDAAAIYDEMLKYQPFIEKGWIMNTAVPAKYDTGAIWSGLRLNNELILRAFTQSTRTVKFTFCPWNEGPNVTLEAPKKGVTYRLIKHGKNITVKIER